MIMQISYTMNSYISERGISPICVIEYCICKFRIKKVEMVDKAIKLCCALINLEVYNSISTDNLTRFRVDQPDLQDYSCPFKSAQLIVNLFFGDTKPLNRTVANCLRSPACDTSSIR